MSAVIGSMQCSNKKIFGQDFDRGRRSEYTAYVSATPLKQAVYNCEANDAMYDKLFTRRVKHLLTNHLHGKAAEHSYK